MIVLNVVIFVVFLLGGIQAFGRAIVEYGAIPSYILRGERLWTLFTSMFMHADIMHLVGNMVYLWVFGDNIEDALGHTKYLVFYLLGGLAASFTHIASLFATSGYVGPYSTFDIPAVGASGAISAVLGAYLLLYPRARIKTLVFFFFFFNIVSIPAFFYLGFWFLYQLLWGVYALTGQYGVAFWAHIGGFLVGLATIKLFGGKPRFRQLSYTDRTSFRSQRPVKPIIVRSQVKRPFADIYSEGDVIRVVAELPGVEERDIKVEVSDTEVVISAQRGEIRYQGQIVLPARVKPRIQAMNYRNGVLNFTLVKLTV